MRRKIILYLTLCLVICVGIVVLLTVIIPRLEAEKVYTAEQCSDKRNKKGYPFIIHHDGGGAREVNEIGNYNIVGHYRWNGL